VLVATVLAACGLLVLSQGWFDGAGRAAFKLVASSAFVWLGYRCGALRSGYGRSLIVGLALSWFGDLFLLGGARESFLAGLACFLLAHIAYITAFARFGLNDRWLLVTLVPVAALSLVVLLWLTPQLPGDMLVPVRAYTFVISVMVILAFGARGAGATVLIPLGATLFYLSDLSVAMLRFAPPGFPHYVWGLPFYYTGQVFLALSVARSGGSRQS